MLALQPETVDDGLGGARAAISRSLFERTMARNKGAESALRAYGVRGEGRGAELCADYRTQKQKRKNPTDSPRTRGVLAPNPIYDRWQNTRGPQTAARASRPRPSRGGPHRNRTHASPLTPLAHAHTPKTRARPHAATPTHAHTHTITLSHTRTHTHTHTHKDTPRDTLSHTPT